MAIALLRWYEANQHVSVQVGSGPAGLAFDGANMWVANRGDGTVTKLRANDGQVLDKFHVGFYSSLAEPISVAFDGLNIWVAGNPSDSTSGLVKIRANDGHQTAIATGSTPGLAYDGVHLWGAWEAASPSSSRASFHFLQCLSTLSPGGLIGV